MNVLPEIKEISKIDIPKMKKKRQSRYLNGCCMLSTSLPTTNNKFMQVYVPLFLLFKFQSGQSDRIKSALWVDAEFGLVLYLHQK